MFEGFLGGIFRYLIITVVVLAAIWIIVLDRMPLSEILGRKPISTKRSQNKTKKRNKRKKKKAKK